MPASNSRSSESILFIPREAQQERDLPDDLPVNWRRYRRTLRFAAWLFARIILWEIVLRRLLGETLTGSRRTRRFKSWAREFRTLAVDMGGVMIKLGQFISSRVDVLPPEIILELASLQDEVPTVPFEAIRQIFEADLGPLDQRFTSFNSIPVAAASLGQAHRAQLPNGERVVVKIQRPGIRTLVYTDLKALLVVAGWAMKFPFIARRANIPALLDEFSAGLWDELDYELEANNAETFSQMFGDDPGIYIPRLYRDLSTRCVLTLEDVTTVKITDYAQIEAAGINRRDVSRRLINTYLRMIFIERFFHADPHPGNLFIYPLPPDAPDSNGRHSNGQTLHGRPFYLIFVDFGMVGRLTPEITAGLRETLIALTTRDPHRLVQSYQRLGILLPGANLERIEVATRAAFDRVWGMNLSELSNMPMSEVATIGREFSDLLFELPFQVPQDFLYLARAVGILDGMCTGLDPHFDPWREMQPFVGALLAQNGEKLNINSTPHSLLSFQTLRGLLAGDGVQNLLMDTTRRAVQFPSLADDVLRRADRGELTVRIAPDPELARQIDTLEHVMQRLVSAVVFAGMAISSALLYGAGEQTLSVIGLALTMVSFVRVLLAGKQKT